MGTVTWLTATKASASFNRMTVPRKKKKKTRRVVHIIAVSCAGPLEPAVKAENHHYDIVAESPLWQVFSADNLRAAGLRFSLGCAEKFRLNDKRPRARGLFIFDGPPTSLAARCVF